MKLNKFVLVFKVTETCFTSSVWVVQRYHYGFNPISEYPWQTAV